jgi:uncharacterized SAM-binding protein YcdF (DUF218 family)
MMDIVVVLGADNDDQGRLSATAIERAEGGRAEFGQRPGAKLLLTGGFGAFNRTTTPHAVYLAAYLKTRRVDPSVFLPFILSGHTVEDAVLSRRGLAETPFENLVVVTSAFHLARTRLIFEHFFAPGRLQFVATPDRVSAGRLARLQAHEQHAIETITGQGGVLYDGVLFPRLSDG